jgi:hypothetical protein
LIKGATDFDIRLRNQRYPPANDLGRLVAERKSQIPAAQSQAAYAARSIRSVRPNNMGGLSESEIGNKETKNTIKLNMIMTANKYKTPAVRRHSGALRKPCESSKAAKGRAIKDTRAAFS